MSMINMIFSPKLYNKPVAELILAGKKTQTRRLVKESEFLIKGFEKNPNNIWVFNNNSQRIKRQVGRDYAVQSGRGKSGLWYCPKCKKVLIKNKRNYECSCYGLSANSYNGNLTEQNIMNWKPLRIVITGIRKERLLDISEVDAKKEGFEGIESFLDAFYSLNPVGKKQKDGVFLVSRLNPFVWVLDFSVKGDK